MASCTTGKTIEIYSDRTAKITQEYSFTNPIELQEKKGIYNTEEERKNYDSPIISEFEDYYGMSFSFKIQDVDSITSYLNQLPKDLVNIELLGDSLLIFQTKEQTKKPDSGLSYWIDFRFDTDIVNVASSEKIQVFWKKKKDPRMVSIYFHPKPMWKKKRTHLVVVELK